MSWKRKIKQLLSLLTLLLDSMILKAMFTHRRMLDALHKMNNQILDLEIYKPKSS